MTHGDYLNEAKVTSNKNIQINERKISFSLVLCSLIRNFSLREKALSLEITKKSGNYIPVGIKL